MHDTRTIATARTLLYLLERRTQLQLEELELVSLLDRVRRRQMRTAQTLASHGIHVPTGDL